jgi:glutamate-ammonia-ligase adenylyltransferase
VTNAEFFVEYFRSRAALWERQSLLRARVLTGSPEDRLAAERLIEEALCEIPLPRDWLGDIRSMRDRIAKERGKGKKDSTDLKTGEGGLLDVEFAVQAVELDEGARRKSARIPGTAPAIRSMASTGRLRKSTARRLEEGYLWLRRLELMGKMQSPTISFRWPYPPDLAGPLASAMGESSAAALERKLRSVLRSNRAMMLMVFDDLRERDA